MFTALSICLTELVLILDPVDSPTFVGPPASLDTMQGDSVVYSMCEVGGKTYLNGESFYPEIGAFGKYENVICTCQVSVALPTHRYMTCSVIFCEILNGLWIEFFFNIFILHFNLTIIYMYN